MKMDQNTDLVIFKTKIYIWQDTLFYFTTFKKVIEITVNVLRDGINLFFLIFLNLLIYIKVRESFGKKKRLINLKKSSKINSIENTSKSNGNDKLNKMNERLLIMIVFGTLNYIFGRLPILIKFLISNFYGEIDFLNTIATLCVYFSYLNNIFLYYFTNSQFQETIHKYFNIAFKFVTKKIKF